MILQGFSPNVLEFRDYLPISYTLKSQPKICEYVLVLPITVITHRRTVIKAGTVQTEMQHLSYQTFGIRFTPSVKTLKTPFLHSVYKATRSRVSEVLILKPGSH